MRGIGLILVFKSARYLPSSLFAPAQYVQIIAATIIGYSVFNEIPTINNYFGIFLIVSAGMYIIFREFELSQKTNKKI
jgi:drug/metabolite transporter (DMT)-like permease